LLRLEATSFTFSHRRRRALARRDVGIVWLASFGALIVFYIGEARITRLGEHPVFDASCTLVLTAAMLAVVWYLHDHMRELVYLLRAFRPSLRAASLSPE
jgi:hypothetical protein